MLHVHTLESAFAEIQLGKDGVTSLSQLEATEPRSSPLPVSPGVWGPMTTGREPAWAKVG